MNKNVTSSQTKDRQTHFGTSNTSCRHKNSVDRVWTQIFVNSALKKSVIKNNVVKKSNNVTVENMNVEKVSIKNCMHVTNGKMPQGATNINSMSVCRLPVRNRFSALQDLEQDLGLDSAYDHKENISCHDGNTTVVNNIDVFSEVCDSKQRGSACENSSEMLDSAYDSSVDSVKQSEHKEVLHNGQRRYDMQKTADIVRMVKQKSQGNTCLNLVKVESIVDKCADLRSCISQQKTAFGFLPITNLKRLKIGSPIKPNSIMIL